MNEKKTIRLCYKETPGLCHKWFENSAAFM